MIAKPRLGREHSTSFRFLETENKNYIRLVLSLSNDFLVSAVREPVVVVVVEEMWRSCLAAFGPSPFSAQASIGRSRRDLRLVLDEFEHAARR